MVSHIPNPLLSSISKPSWNINTSVCRSLGTFHELPLHPTSVFTSFKDGSESSFTLGHRQHLAWDLIQNGCLVKGLTDLKPHLTVGERESKGVDISSLILGQNPALLPGHHPFTWPCCHTLALYSIIAESSWEIPNSYSETHGYSSHCCSRWDSTQGTKTKARNTTAQAQQGLHEVLNLHN